MNIDPTEELKKWEFLRDAPKSDAETPEIKLYAQHLAAIAARSPWPEWCLASLALALARDCILYQLDSDRVGREQIDGYTDPQGPADAPYRRGVDDCDAKARFFVAVCLAGAVPADMVPRWKGPMLAHVYGSCWVRGPHELVPRVWYAETIVRRARLGEVAEQVPKEPETGKWLF